MSCKDLDKDENLVYIRRTNGGSSVGGVIYSWDYYVLASLPTNDNIRYQKPKDGISPNVSLHEIGNNRYENVKCKSVHLAYNIGGFSTSAPIEMDEFSNQIEERQQVTDNPCVLLFANSNYFPERNPECWPWSCRRWTREVTRTCDGKVDKDEYFYQNINGEKTAYGSFDDKKNFTSFSPPKLGLTLSSEDIETSSFYYDLETITKDEYPTNCPESTVQNIPTAIEDGKNYLRGHLSKEIIIIQKGTEDLDPDILKKYGCDSTDEKITLITEMFPVLCNGVCKLLIKLACMCYADKTSSNKYVGNGIKKLIEPFWSCRINETLKLYRESDSYIYKNYYDTNPLLLDYADRSETGVVTPSENEIFFNVEEMYNIKNTLLTLLVVAKVPLLDNYNKTIPQEYRKIELGIKLVSPAGVETEEMNLIFIPDPQHFETFMYVRFNDEYPLEESLPEGILDGSSLPALVVEPPSEEPIYPNLPFYESNKFIGNPIAWRDGSEIFPVTFGKTPLELSQFTDKKSNGEWTLVIKNHSWLSEINVINATLSLGKGFPTQTELASVSIALNAADEQFSQNDLFNSSKPVYYTVTGQDYTLDPVYDDPNSKDKKLIGHSRKNWNVCDKPKKETYFPIGKEEGIGVANKFLDVQDRCCKKCRKKDPGDMYFTFFDDAFCSELDKECAGEGYSDIEREGGCP